MSPRRKKFLMWTLVIAAISAFVGTVVKMLVTDLWPEYLRPLVSTAWTWTLEVLTWFAQPVTFPLWSFIAVALVVLGVTGVLVYFVASLGVDLNAANAKLNPPLPLLNEEQQEVLTIVARHDDESAELSKSDVRGFTELSQLACSGALDVLYDEGLIDVLYGRWGTVVTLKPKGRAYVLDSRSPLPWSPKRA